MNDKYMALLLELIPLIDTILRIFLALPSSDKLISTICLVTLMLTVTFCAICWNLINKKNPFH
ncbi:hypothetical protein FAD87_RS14185 [Enterococcus hirae]|uniref:hypothetical protein n=1 Tax=Enterococcus TaxID=1350 RepID=UPI0015C442F1|nr:hypothetical protein [Enterococcus hirae]